jgi:hypothetical protein
VEEGTLKKVYNEKNFRIVMNKVALITGITGQDGSYCWLRDYY